MVWDVEAAKVVLGSSVGYIEDHSPPVGEIRYTTAPSAYDGFGTKTLELKWVWQSKLNGNTKPVRKVVINPEHLQWQTMRYGSGMHPTWTEADFAEYKNHGDIRDWTLKEQV